MAHYTKDYVTVKILFCILKNNLHIVDNHKTTLENDKKGESPIQYTTHLLAVSKGSSIS